MDREELELILREGEGLTVEFKESFSSKLDKDIVAFANSHGGHILLGIDDNSQIVGEQLTNDLKAKINSLARNCEPGVKIKNIEQIDAVVVITIEESYEKPHSCAAGYYRRLDAATQKMNQKELKLLFEEHNLQPRFEEKINGDVTWDHISLSKIKTFLLETKINLYDINVHKLLSSLHLTKENKINNAGVLFFANNPRDFILQCEMTLVAFKGKAGVNIYDRVNVQDDLITQFNEAITFLKKHLNIRNEIKGVDRYDICEIPLEALREAVVNAIIHRDYSIRGTGLIIEVHEDRVVIKNPGGLLPGISIDSLTQISIRRNEIIADMFARINKAERIGSGIRRIMDFMINAGLGIPMIESDVFFSITFERNPKFKVSNTVLVEDDNIDNFNLRQEKILNILKNKRLSPKEILNLLEEDITERTLRRDLEYLRKNGYIGSDGQLGPKTKLFVIKTKQ